MNRFDQASRLGMVAFLLIATVLYVRERAWTEHASRAKATVVGTWTSYGGRLWNRTPVQVVEVEFPHRQTLTKATMRSWTHRHKAGDVLEVLYEPSDPTTVYPASDPLAERPSTIMGLIGAFLGFLAVVEFFQGRNARQVNRYLKTLDQVAALDPDPGPLTTSGGGDRFDEQPNPLVGPCPQKLRLPPFMTAPSARDDHETVMAACQKVLEYEFQNPAFLRSALTHASGADHRLASNERLEFLGDAILGAVVCDVLYHRFPESEEGELTRIKSHVVSRKTCTAISRKLGLDEFLFLGKGMGGQGPTPASVLADVFESLVGAIYLDGGTGAARRFILRHLLPEIDEMGEGDWGINHKSHLQQVAQRQFSATPTYQLLDEKGPDHSKCFKIAAQVAGTCYPAAWGPTKKDAEQRAAQNALSQLAGQPVPFQSD